MNYIENIDVQNKKVILRLDLNVTIKDGKILDDTKIKKSIPTIKYLLNNKAHILIMSHLGKVKTEEDKKNNSLKLVAEVLSELLNKKVNFVPEIESDALNKSICDNEITLMENTRFADINNKRESNCDLKLAQYWASLGEVFINDAFGTTHRKHASNYGIAKYLPSAYGFLINEELNGLDPVINNITKPFTVIMGGAKVDDKIALIENIIKECDYLLVGGGIANTFLKANGYNIGLSLYSEDCFENIKEIVKNYKDKIWMPVDVVVKEDNQVRVCDVTDVKTDSTIYDIGPKTVECYSKIINNSKTIFLNGTMGMYEEKEYRSGTEGLYKNIDNKDKVVIAGGGDALSSINKLGYKRNFDFLSTGGGATLDYIANKKLKCFED